MNTSQPDGREAGSDEILPCPNSDVQLVDPSQFPFHTLDDFKFQTCVRGRFADEWDERFGTRPRGNYIASSILIKHRLKAKEARPRFKALNFIFDLPTELFVLILERLHPIDLYHLTRTTRTLKKFLLNARADSVWKKCFLAHRDIPLYPSVIFPAKWADMLFGPAVCDDCYNRNIMSDFVFGERHCQPDLLFADQNPLNSSLQEVFNRHPVIEADIWKLVRGTYKIDAFFYPNDSDYYYSKPRYSPKDVMKKTSELETLMEGIVLGAPPASYQTFVEATAVTTKDYLQYARQCENWANGILEKYRNEFYASIPRFCSSIEKVLRKRGYDERDMQTVFFGFKRMLKANWHAVSYPLLRKSLIWKYLPGLEDNLIDAKEARLQDVLEERIRRRQNIVTDSYKKTFRTHLKSCVAPYLPSPSVLFKFPPFDDFINDPQELEGNFSFSEEITQQEFIQYVESIMMNRKQHLVKLLLDAGVDNSEQGDGSDPFDTLELATAVFECSLADHTNVFIGWEETGTHMPCCSSENLSFGESALGIQTPFRFSQIGRQALDGLTVILNVDLRSARAKDLDATRKRFLCRMCVFEQRAGFIGLVSMDWRECLTHAVEAGNKDGGHTAAFDIVSDEFTKSLHAMEKLHPAPTEWSWCCNHCNEHFVYAARRPEVVTHVNKVHHVQKPIMDIDFFFRRTGDSRKRKPLFVGLGGDSNWRCIHCTGAVKMLKLWGKDPLRQHLNDSHHKETELLLEGVDLIRIKPVQDQSWIHKALSEKFVSASALLSDL